MNSPPTTDLAYWIAAAQLAGVSLRKLLAWLNHHGDYQSLFAASATELEAAGFTESEKEKIKTVNWSAIAREEKAYQKEEFILTLKDPRYPSQLKEIADPPLVLYVCGDLEALVAPQLAVVGSRQSSLLGCETAAKFARDLVQSGYVISSGLALGIDGAAHRSALLAGGKTIAVMGTGLNQIYPRVHRRLAEQIRQQGALVSEFPWNTPPSPWNFPRRNRIISGLSLGVLVVEAAVRSGSLITARYALEQNREVFAVPGSINHVLARGCHHLIQQGAKLVETAGDLVEELGFRCNLVPKQDKRREPEPIDYQHKTVLEQLDYSLTSFDLILLRSGLTASEVSSILLSLELKGYIEAVQGGYLRRV